MARFQRLSLLLVPLTLSFLTQAHPGQAQQATSARYAFSDTTLLRDTLGLRFGALFPTADSLQLTPDTLRALMIRYRLTMPRLLHLSDSLTVPVDSVGPLLQRELFNPLANRGRNVSTTDFQYTSGYDIQRTTTTWTNGSQYRMVRNAAYLNNVTNIELQRITSAGLLSLRQNREATTEAGMTVNRNVSVGGRSYQLRFFSADPGSPTTQDENKNEYSLTSRLQAKSKNVISEGNLRSGWLDDNNVSGIKRGFSGSADGRLRLQSGQTFSHDLSGSVTGNFARTRLPTSVLEQNTRDFSTNVRGTLTVLANAPVGLNVNYSFRHSRVETPLDEVQINSIVTRGNSADATLRMRKDNDRYLNLNGSVSRSDNQNGSRTDGSGKATLRWLLSSAAIDVNYGDTRSHADYPRRNSTGGYREYGLQRSADGQLVRPLGRRFITKVLANIALEQYRYAATAIGASPPTKRDAFRQQYRGELNFNPSPKVTSGLVLQVSLNQTINISSLATGSNNDIRSYRGEWRWNYLIFPSLTVTQNNALSADYQSYPYSPARNVLSLNHNTTTSLSARLPGSLFIDLQHNTSRLPRGSYLRQADGFNYLQLSDDSRNYTLNTSIRYQPTAGLGIHAEPRYQTSERSGTVNGEQQKQRADKRLDFSGGVDLNWRVGVKGQLTGRISRSYTDQRTIQYSNGIGKLSPRSETDFWNGNLQFTWSL